MRFHLLRLVFPIAIGLLTCAVGCHLSDVYSGRTTVRNIPSDNDSERLSDRQIADMQLSMARSLEQQGDPERALEAYREVAKKNPRKGTVYWRMAVLHDRQGNIQESEALYRKALKADPKNPDVHCDFGYSLYLQKRWAESEEHLRRSVALNSAHQRGHNNLGLLLAQTDQLDEALDEFRRSGCPEAESHANLAFVLTLNRRWDDARAEYQLALDANPRSIAAKSGLESLAAIHAKAVPATAKVTPAGYEIETTHRLPPP